MNSLPEELLLHVSTFLNGRDIVKLSHSRFYNLFSNDHIWRQIIKREQLVTEKAIETLALTLAAESGGRRSVSKWSYILHSKLKRNWLKANFKTSSIPLSDRCALGHDSKNLVVFEPNENYSAWKVSVFRIDGKGATLTTSRQNWSIDRLSTSQSIASVFVANDVALVCFNDDGGTSQEIVAIDLEDLCERWRDDSDLTRLFGSEIFAFHFSTYTVNICDIKTQTNLRTVALPLDVRLPYGQVSCDGRNLVVPGKMVVDNSPVVCCTNVFNGSHKYLAPSTPVCPYRWFEKTEVLKGKVYGLLNRKTLFIWNAESGACISRLEISESPPGMAESNLSCNFLTAGHGLVATIHVDPSTVNVFNCNDDAKSTFEVNMAQIMGAPVKVCDVFLNPHCLLVRAANCQIPQFHVSIFPLPLKDDIRESYAESKLINLVPVEDCNILHLGVTPSKILNFAEGQLRIYDFIC